MADIEQRVDKLEEKVARLELNINKSLGDIKTDLTEIKTYVQTNSSNNDLKNNLIEKDVVSNKERIKKLEDNQSKIAWAIIMSVIGLISEAVLFYLKSK